MQKIIKHFNKQADDKNVDKEAFLNAIIAERADTINAHLDAKDPQDFLTKIKLFYDGKITESAYDAAYELFGEEPPVKKKFTYAGTIKENKNGQNEINGKLLTESTVQTEDGRTLKLEAIKPSLKDLYNKFAAICSS